MKKASTLHLLRIIALLAVLSGAVGSLILMFNAGRYQKSIFLIALFTVWVLSPFIALVAASVFAKRRSGNTRLAIYFLMLIITIGSLAIYSGVVSFPGTKTAFPFLVVPLVSWLFIAGVVSVAEWQASKLSGKHNRPDQ